MSDPSIDINEETEELPNFTRKQAWEVYGTHVPVGETYLDSQGEILERRQFHEKANRVSPEEGMVLQLADGQNIRCPRIVEDGRRRSRESTDCGPRAKW